MNLGIFLIQDIEELVPMSEQTYEFESLLQKLLSQVPRPLGRGPNRQLRHLGDGCFEV